MSTTISSNTNLEMVNTNIGRFWSFWVDWDRTPIFFARRDVVRHRYFTPIDRFWSLWVDSSRRLVTL